MPVGSRVSLGRSVSTGMNVLQVPSFAGGKSALETSDATVGKLQGRAAFRTTREQPDGSCTHGVTFPVVGGLSHEDPHTRSMPGRPILAHCGREVAESVREPKVLPR